ncbi:MAG TPA: hypothetical protein VKS78_08675 [Roseiarcus sp.]|nr:hypothetical protein [Roseiarcus sp.]
MTSENKGAPTPRGVQAASILIVIIALGIAVGAAAWLVSSPQPRAPGASAGSAARPLAMANCSGSVDETPDQSPWTIPLDHCDKTIDDIDIKAGFLQKWTICGGADSFAISLNPRAVTVTGDHIHCSNIKSEVAVTYIGFAK